MLNTYDDPRTRVVLNEQRIGASSSLNNPTKEVVGPYERLPPESVNDEQFQLHIGRYVFASQFVKGKTVLDVASGTGYGSHYMAKFGAARIIGADNSLDALNYAKRHQREQLQFVLADATNMPFGDDSFELLVSFETVEHIEQYDTFLSECTRVLRTGGSLICSTPNKKVTVARHEKNPYHKCEFEPPEFLDLLKKYFGEVHCFGQGNKCLLRLKATDTFFNIIYSKMRVFGPIAWYGYQKFNSFQNNIWRSRIPKINANDICFEDVLHDKFKVTRFRDNFWVTPYYLLALCKKPKKQKN